jgi:hypothetical protein
MSLDPRQVEVLLRPIKPGRVAKREGLSNVESPAFYLMQNESFPVSSQLITLPPDAKPGMWAVQLQVHQ